MKIFALVLISIISLFMAVLLVNLSVLSLSIALVVVLLPLIIMRPGAYFILFLLFRPLMDMIPVYRLPGGLNLASLTAILLVLICGSMLLRKESLQFLLTDKFLGKFNLLSALFIFSCVLSMFNSYDKAASFSDLVRILAVIVSVNYAGVYFSGWKKGKKLQIIILCSGFLPVLIGIYQLVSASGMQELGFNRIRGTFVHPNVFAEYLVLFALLSLNMLYSKGRKRPLQLAAQVSALVVALIAMMFTYTRGAWIAALAGMGFYLLYGQRMSSKLKYVLLLVAFLALLSPFIKHRFGDLQVKKEGQISSWQWRLKQWTASVDNISRHPVVGRGMGMYERDFRVMAHNDYIRIAYETGFCGLMAYVGMLLYALFFALHRAHLAERLSGDLKLAVCLVIALLIMSMADNLARSTLILLYFLAVVGSVNSAASASEET